MSELVLGVGPAHKFEHALRRHGWSLANLDSLSEGDILGQVRQVILGRAEIVAIKPRLLEPVTTVKVAGAKKFIAADHFVVGQDEITYLGDNFKKVFLGKVETDVQPATIMIHRLTESSLDVPIRAELGVDREEIALAHFWTVFKKRLASADWFFTYIHGTDGDLWAVDAFRDSDGWYVHARSVTDSCRWTAGSQVLSR